MQDPKLSKARTLVADDEESQRAFIGVPDIGKKSSSNPIVGRWQTICGRGCCRFVPSPFQGYKKRCLITSK